MEKTVNVERSLLFPPFRLELGNERLWRGSQATVLRPKTFAVLRYLAEHAGQLVPTGVVLDAIWPGTYVSDTLVKDSIHELRKVLGDDAKRPRFIETVHRRGYRWVAPLTAALPVQSLGSRVQSPHSAIRIQSGGPGGGAGATARVVREGTRGRAATRLRHG